ncbi:MAG: Flagellar hook-associated protein 2 [Pseudomonadota bacterium]
MVTASSAINGSSLISALGTGSGVDVRTLAQNLVDAEKEPKAKLIQKQIDQSQLRVTGYSTVSFAVTQLQSSLQALQNASAFDVFKGSSSQPQVLGVGVSSEASVGSHTVEVRELARAQRSISRGFSGATAALNGGAPVTVTLSPVGQSDIDLELDASQATPQGLVDAVNALGLGVKASLVNTGSSGTPFKIVLTGQTGAANAFSVTSDAAVDLGFPAVAATDALGNATARDAHAIVDGIPLYRPTNRLSDVVKGMNLDLLATNSGAPATVTVSRDTSTVKEKISTLVSNYNDLQAILDAATDKNSQVEKLGGSLVNDPTVRRIRDQIRQMFMPNGGTADVTAPLTNLRQLGLFIDSDNRMKFVTLKESARPGESLLNMNDESGLDKMLSNRFDDVARLFSGPGGLGKDLADRLSGSGQYTDSSVRPVSPLRVLSVQTRGAVERATASKDRLTELEERMSALMDRYVKQFALMDSLVGQSKSLRTSVENSFKGMSNVR